MAKTKILCMADGGLTPDIFQRMKDLEKSFDCEVTIMVDESISTYTKTMDRMHECEYEGIKAAMTYPPLLEAVKDADILCVHMTSVNREVIEAGKNLKIVDCMRGGFENVDIKACTEHGIIMINSSWRSAPAVADTTIGMMIAENKNIARSHLAIVQGGWRKQYKNQAYIRNMDRCTVGIIGFGYIGRQVVRRLKGFGCKILVYDPFLDPKVITDAGETFAPLDELLEKSDFVSLHIRLSEKTHHWFGAEQFASSRRCRTRPLAAPRWMCSTRSPSPPTLPSARSTTSPCFRTWPAPPATPWPARSTSALTTSAVSCAASPWKMCATPKCSTTAGRTRASKLPACFGKGRLLPKETKKGPSLKRDGPFCVPAAKSALQELFLFKVPDHQTKHCQAEHDDVKVTAAPL